MKLKDGAKIGKEIGTYGVDSGQVYVVDPCYVEDGLGYDDICGKDGRVGPGVISSTTYGDGVYSIREITAPLQGLAGAPVRRRRVALLVMLTSEEEVLEK